MSEQVDILRLPAEEDPIRRALDCLREGFQIIGFDWKYVYVNPAAARHGRRPARELIGQPIVQEYPGIEQTSLFVVLRKAMEERTSHVFENEFTFPDGSSHWFEIRVQPVPEGICVYSSDIDYRKRREQSRAADGGARPGLLGRLIQLFGPSRAGGGR